MCEFDDGYVKGYVPCMREATQYNIHQHNKRRIRRKDYNYDYQQCWYKNKRKWWNKKNVECWEDSIKSNNSLGNEKIHKSKLKVVNKKKEI